MRARHRHRGEKSAHHSVKSSGVHPLPHNVIRTGEGAAPKLHAGKRARGGGIHIKKSHQGLLHKNLGVASDKAIPAKKLSKALHSSDPAVKKRAVFAENAKHWHH